MYDLFIGIDVSKESSSAHGLTKEGKSSFSMSFAMNSDGFSELLMTVTSHCKDLSGVIIAMESTACYHINLFSFLTSKDINAVIINPLLISNFTKLSLRKTKTDKKDARTIAQFLIVNKDSISNMSISQDKQDLRDIARERESLSHLISANKTEIKRILQTIFPELESICNIFTKTLLNFIKEYPSARIIKAARPKAIAKALKPPGQGNKISFSPDKILEAAKTSIASFSPAKELILPGKILTLMHLEERRDELTKVLIEYCKSAMIKDLQIITSIDGIDNGTATTFLAEMGHIANYASHKNLIAFAGIDPTVYQSGKFEGYSRISKRGNRHLRRKEDGLPSKKAIFATAHKLIRVIFAMLSQRTYFKENYS
ncbi:MAG: IS110 family transposase [Nitrospirae bacterium]|nr:IS110 family transposase [Nitrospirota bacterium]